MQKASLRIAAQKITNEKLRPLSSFCLLLFLCLLLCACETGIYHTVRPGQTLYRISHTYGVNEDYLARLNAVADPAQLKIGTRLYIPGAERVLRVPVVKPEVKPAPPAAVKKTVVSKPMKTPPVVAKQPPQRPFVLPKASKATVVDKLRWPLRGKIVRSFSSQAKAGGGKGIEIAVRAASEVTAAEAGKVIYSGDGVNGYGFLIILQHENDLFTVYGFNQRNVVKQGDFVSKGEKIALSGTPPAGGQPRLHFEVRKGKQAVDPILYLP
ncbi:MAG: M23 family metallopeptidase [Deltaproteobacteria bacterium]|jgi:lipoprotein NlpD|nr:M23 family metallopeptidase [Deltaproteobacteria bacterium]